MADGKVGAVEIATNSCCAVGEAFNQEARRGIEAAKAHAVDEGEGDDSESDRGADLLGFLSFGPDCC